MTFPSRVTSSSSASNPPVEKCPHAVNAGALPSRPPVERRNALPRTSSSIVHALGARVELFSGRPLRRSERATFQGLVFFGHTAPGESHPAHGHLRAAPAGESPGEGVYHLAPDGPTKAHCPGLRHRVGVVDGAGCRRVSELGSKGVREGERHGFATFVVGIVQHRHRDGLARLPRSEGERARGIGVVRPPAVAVPSEVAYATVVAV